MALYLRFEKLPDKGTAVESAVLDLKREMSPKRESHFTLANDVAAFANHLGGAHLIGATEAQGVVGAYSGIPTSFADELQTAFTEAIKDRCSPRPLYDFARFPAETPHWHVLAVFVEPYLGGQLVGVAVKGSESNDKYKGDSFVFPMRSGKATTHLLPEQLPMFTEPRIRRISVQLNAIPSGAEVKVYPIPFGGTHPQADAGRLREVNGEMNYFIVELYPGVGRPAGALTPRRYPVDHVRSVYPDTDSRWVIIVEPFF